MVIFATRTVLDANRQVVDVLHLVGAKDSYIAHQIDSRFLRTGFMAGLLGVGLGVVTFFLLGLAGTMGSAAWPMPAAGCCSRRRKLPCGAMAYCSAYRSLRR